MTPARQGTARARPVTLCFHGVGRPVGPEREPGEHAYWVSRDRFLRSLDEIAEQPAGSIGITFDDGNESDLAIALPALLERDLTATFFVLAGRLGEAGSLDAAGVRELERQGMVIGSHGMQHRPWRRLSASQRHEEIVEARRVLEGVVRHAVEVAAVPLGRYDGATLLALRRHGYRRVYTSDRWTAGPRSWLQPRRSARSSDEPGWVHATRQRPRDPVGTVRALAGTAAKVLRP